MVVIQLLQRTKAGMGRYISAKNLWALSCCLIDLSLASDSRAYDRYINAVIDPSKARCDFHGAAGEFASPMDTVGGGMRYSLDYMSPR